MFEFCKRHLPVSDLDLIWRFLRSIHTRGFAPGACSRLILHVSVHTRERFQVRSICPGSLPPNIQPVKYRGTFCGVEILLPRMKYTNEIVGTHGGALLPKRAPGACSGRKIPGVYRPLKKTTKPLKVQCLCPELSSIMSCHFGKKA